MSNLLLLVDSLELVQLSSLDVLVSLLVQKFQLSFQLAEFGVVLLAVLLFWRVFPLEGAFPWFSDPL